MADERTVLEHAIASQLGDLGKIELMILAEIQRRMLMGQIQYGHFPREEKRDLIRETVEEVLDAAVYAARKLLLL